MTAKELQKRNIKSDNLRVLQTEDGPLHVQAGDIHLRRTNDRIN